MVKQGGRRAAIIGLGGSVLTAEEAAMLRQMPPLGVILFARNIAGPAPLRGLTDAIREILGEQAPILIDQEGGRVARLRPPDWPPFRRRPVSRAGLGIMPMPMPRSSGWNAPRWG